MAFEITTPLLKLGAEIVRWTIAEAAGNKADAGPALRFARAIQGLGPRLLTGSVEPRPVDRQKLEKLDSAWGALPLHLRYRIVEWSRLHQCADRLEKLIGPLPETEAQNDRQPPEPMF